MDEKGSGASGIYRNYDAVFKDAMTLFKGKTLDFLGLGNFPEIEEVLGTEQAELSVISEFSELNFGLADGRGAHAEMEVDITKPDLYRFCSYNVHSSRTHKREFITVIFTLKTPAHTCIDTECLKFTPVIVDCSQKDADAGLEELKTKIRNGEPVNELSLIYLPLFKSKSLRPVELLKEAALLVRELNAEETMKQKILALMLVVSNKVVNADELEKIWKEHGKMMNLKIFDVVRKDGLEEGLERGAVNMLKKNYPAEEVASVMGISLEKVLSLKREAALS